MKSVYSAVRADSLYGADYVWSLKGLFSADGTIAHQPDSDLNQVPYTKRRPTRRSFKTTDSQHNRNATTYLLDTLRQGKSYQPSTAGLKRAIH